MIYLDYSMLNGREPVIFLDYSMLNGREPVIFLNYSMLNGREPVIFLHYSMLYGREPVIAVDFQPKESSFPCLMYLTAGTTEDRTGRTENLGQNR